MKGRWRLAALIAGAVLLVWVIVEIFTAGGGPGGAPPPSGLQAMTLHGGRVTGNRMSTKSWMFVYQHAEMSPDGVTASVDGIHQGVLYKDRKPYLSVDAQHVSVNTQTFDFVATGDVHITQAAQPGSASRSFDTDLIQWANATKSLTLPHPSIVRSGDQTLRVATVNVNFNTGDIRLGKISGGIAP